LFVKPLNDIDHANGIAIQPFEFRNGFDVV